MNEFPIKLRREDLPAPADPDDLNAQLAALCRDLERGVISLSDLAQNWADDPFPISRQIQNKRRELVEQAAQINEVREQLSRAHRFHRVAAP